MATAESPLKVSGSTKEKVRLAAAMLNIKQSHFVDMAVEEAIERRAAEFAEGVRRAEAALLRGEIDAIAFALDEDVEAVKRVAGKRE